MGSFPIARNLEQKYPWLLALGAVMVVGGFFALAFVGLTSLFSVLYLGGVFMLTGVSEIIFSLRTRHDGHLWYHLLVGALFAVVGWFVFTNPITNLVVLTLLIATVLLVTGIVTLVGSLVEQFEHWGWFALNGVVSIAAGFLIWSQPLRSSVWLIGVLVGVELIFRGLAWLRLGFVGRDLALMHTAGHSARG